MHVDNKEKDALILGEVPTWGLDDTTLTAKAKYPINFTQPEKRFALSLHYNGSNSFLFVTTTKVYQFNAKNSEIKDYALCLGNVSKDFTINNIKNRIKRSCKIFFVDFNPIDITILQISINIWWKEHNIKKMFKIIKKMFPVLLSSIVKVFTEN